MTALAEAASMVSRPKERATMRIHSIHIRNTPPVRYFGVDDLADVVVLAGPNGVGKTRLLQRVITHLRSGSVNPDVQGTIEATSREERAAWGKTLLDLSDPADVGLFSQTLQANRRRRNLKSSLVNFDSDRSIQTIQPLQFSWDMPDPDEEEVSWDFTFGFMRDRFQDTLHSMFRLIEGQKQSIANRAIELRRQGREEMALRFDDPMEPFKEVFFSLLGPKQLVDPSARQQRLEYSIEGEVFDIATLSSGEREVVNIAFDFLLRKPTDCIVFFDEPELHLHPELSYKLIQTLETIGSKNQFLLSTHSADLITASLDRSVIFVSPASDEDGQEADGYVDALNQAIPVSEADETNQALKLLGQSIGIIALGKKIVLVEGAQSSTDKQVYGSIIKNRWPGLVLVPSGGKHVVESFDRVYDGVLSKSVWGVEFFMLCDRDAAPDASTEGAEAVASGRLRVLSRYHLENYFLDEGVWARAFSGMEDPGSWLLDPAQIRERLRTLAQELVSYGAALTVASEVRQAVGNVDVMPSDCHGRSLQELKDLVEARVESERQRVAVELDASAVAERVEEHFERLKASLDADDDAWRADLPGKPLLGRFAQAAGIKPSRAKTLYVNAALDGGNNPFSEIESIFGDFAA